MLKKGEQAGKQGPGERWSSSSLWTIVLWWRRSELLQWEKWEKKEFLSSVESSIPDSQIFPGGCHSSGSSHGFHIPKEWSQRPKLWGWVVGAAIPTASPGRFCTDRLAPTAWKRFLQDTLFCKESLERFRHGCLEDIWGPNKEQRHLCVFSTHLCARGCGHCEPMCVLVSNSGSCCSHPRCLNSLFNSFLSEPCSVVIWRRIHCVTTGKL